MVMRRNEDEGMRKGDGAVDGEGTSSGLLMCNTVNDVIDINQDITNLGINTKSFIRHTIVICSGKHDNN